MTDQPMGTWTRRLRWDEENRLLAAWAEGAGAPSDTWAFAYGHNGERVLKYRIDGDAVAEAELYLRDEQGNVLTELDWVDTGVGGYWARAKDHVYLGRDLIGSLDYTDGDPHIVTYARDHLGTQRAEVRGLDTATTTDLWPYGAVAHTKLSGDAPPLSNGAHLFTGHERDFMGTEADPLEGLDYMHARYYSHEVGRFLSVDPVEGSIGSSQSWNTYSYVQDNPINLADPRGQCVWDACAGETYAAVAAAAALTAATITWLNSPNPGNPSQTNAQWLGGLASSVFSVGQRPRKRPFVKRPPRGTKGYPGNKKAGSPPLRPGRIPPPQLPTIKGPQIPPGGGSLIRWALTGLALEQQQGHQKGKGKPPGTKRKPPRQPKLVPPKKTKKQPDDDLMHSLGFFYQQTNSGMSRMAR